MPLAWEDLGVTGTIRGRWFAGTAFAEGTLYVFGGQGNSRSNDSGILGKIRSTRVSSLQYLVVSVVYCWRIFVSLAAQYSTQHSVYNLQL